MRAKLARWGTASVHVFNGSFPGTFDISASVLRVLDVQPIPCVCEVAICDGYILHACRLGLGSAQLGFSRHDINKRKCSVPPLISEPMAQPAALVQTAVTFLMWMFLHGCAYLYPKQSHPLLIAICQKSHVLSEHA